MSYTKQTWATGDTITAEKLNHMEDGINASATDGVDIFVVKVTTDSEDESIKYFDKSASEIYDAIEAGKFIGLQFGNDTSIRIASIDSYGYYEGSGYEVYLSIVDYYRLKEFYLWQNIGEENTTITYTEVDLVPFLKVVVSDTNYSKRASVAASDLGWDTPVIGGMTSNHNSLLYTENGFLRFSIDSVSNPPKLELTVYSYTGTGTELTKTMYSADLTAI